MKEDRKHQEKARGRKPAGRKSRRVDPLSNLEEAESLRDDLPPQVDESYSAGGEGTRAPLLRRAREWSAERSFEALSRIAGAVTANLDLRSLVKQVLDTAVQSLGADRGIIFLGRGRDSELVPAVALSITGEEMQDLERVSRTILRQGTEGVSVVTPDAMQDERLRDVPSIQLNQIRSVICVPMVSRGEAVGVIYLDAPSTRGAFPGHARRFLEVYAGLAAAALDNARLHGEVLRQNVHLRSSLHSLESFRRLVTVSPKMEALLQKAALAAEVDTPALILGEPGTGKELLARTIHEASQRALNPFVVCNCAVLPRDLAEGLLFGRVKDDPARSLGKMTGLLSQADRGVLLMEEVAQLDPLIQEKLLRFVQEGIVCPVGSRRGARVDLRLIAATNDGIEAAVRAGHLRRDLYYSLNTLELQVPPLRERLEDIPVLVEHFLQRHAPATKGRRRLTFTPDAFDYLWTRTWPGNVRELENLVRRVVALAERSRVTADALRDMLTSASVGTAAVTAAPGAAKSASPPRIRRAARFRRRIAVSKRSAEDGDIGDELLREQISDAMTRAGGNRIKAARLLGVHRNTLRRWMRRLGDS